MALIKCKECGKEISDQATTCLNCGCIVKSKESKNQNNMFITSSVCSGISLILINPFCILSILGIVFGIISICTEKKNVGWSIASIIIAILATLFYFARLIIL